MHLPPYWGCLAFIWADPSFCKSMPISYQYTSSWYTRVCSSLNTLMQPLWPPFIFLNDFYPKLFLLLSLWESNSLIQAGTTNPDVDWHPISFPFLALMGFLVDSLVKFLAQIYLGPPPWSPFTPPWRQAILWDSGSGELDLFLTPSGLVHLALL